MTLQSPASPICVSLRLLDSDIGGLTKKVRVVGSDWHQMSDPEKCAACVATLPDGAVECGVCKERETWVTVASGGVLERVGAGIFDFVFLGSVIAGLLIAGVGLWSVFVAWIAFIELGYQLRGSPEKLCSGCL